MAILSGVVGEDGEGFIVLRNGTRITVRSNLRPAGLMVGTRVVVTAQLRGVEWVAEHVEIAG